MKNQIRTKITRKIKVSGLAVLILCFSSLAQANPVAGVAFSQQYTDEGITMELQGTGLKTLVLFKAFAAGFYQEKSFQKDILGEVSKRIEVEYFVNIPGEKLNAYTLERMKVNVSEDELNDINAEIKMMGNYFVDLKKGDRFSLTYIPGVGTKFAHNGKETGVIEGQQFAKALFSVWIGEKPFDQKLKNQILGLENEIQMTNKELAMSTEDRGKI